MLMVKYKCIKALYNHPFSKNKVNTYTTSWFTIEMKQLNMGIPFDNDKICILLYADDIVILAEDPAQLQLLLNFTNT